MVFRNFATMSALSVFRSAVQLGINVLLAFFVDPGQYGLVAFSTPFIVLVGMLTDLGMSSALVRMEALDRRTVGAAFTLLVAVGLLLSLLLVLATPLIARGVHMPGLPGVLVGMTVGALLSIAAIVPRAMLERSLRYGTIALTESLAVVAAATVAVAMAVGGAGVWALVSFTIVTNALRAAVFGVLARRSMTIGFEWRRCTGVAAFGSWVLLTNLLTFFARNFDNLLIGAVLGAASVGLYGLAYQFMMIPMIAITWPASGVLLATLSRGGYDGKQREAIVLATLGVTAALTFPTMICLGLAFPDFARQVLSPRWRGIGEVLAWLAPLGALQSLSSYNGTLLLVAGRARAQFIASASYTTLTIVACLIGVRWGLPGMVRAIVLSGVLASACFITVMITVAGLSWKKFLSSLSPAVCASAVVVGVDTVYTLFGDGVYAWQIVIILTFAGTLCVYSAFVNQFRKWILVLAPTRGNDDVTESRRRLT